MKEPYKNNKKIQLSNIRYSISQLLVLLIFALPLLLLFSLWRFEEWTLRLKSIPRKKVLLQFLEPIKPYSLDKGFQKLQKKFYRFQTMQSFYEHPDKEIIKLGRRPLRYFSPEHPLKVLLIGDSLADAINMTLAPLIRSYDKIELDLQSAVSSTLTNNHFINWPVSLEKSLAQKSYDIILIYLGANSSQGIYLNEEQRGLVFPTEAWKQAYKQRIKNFVSQAQSANTPVWWIATPPMLAQDYQELLNKVDNAIEEALEEVNVPLISVAKIIGDSNGAYTQSKLIDNSLVQLRARDGVHYTIAGSMLISKHIIALLEDEFKL